MTFVKDRSTITHRADDRPRTGDVPGGQIVPSSYFKWKRITSPLLGFLLLIPGMPIMLLLMLLVRLTSPGPGVYRQTRVGRGGRTFKMYKIRTMRHDAEAVCGPEWTQKDDPRITPLGRVLRKLHLDEFPQLFNVLKGEMNLIGPRPERPEFTQVLAAEIPSYLDRLAVPPGITGLAQINLPPDTDVDSVRRKLVLDLEYVREASILLDLRMFMCTLLRLLGLKGEYAMGLMRLERHVPRPSPGGTNGAPADAQPVGRRTPRTIMGLNGASRNGSTAHEVVGGGGAGDAASGGDGSAAAGSVPGTNGATYSNGSAKRGTASRPMLSRETRPGP